MKKYVTLAAFLSIGLLYYLIQDASRDDNTSSIVADSAVEERVHSGQIKKDRACRAVPYAFVKDSPRPRFGFKWVEYRDSIKQSLNGQKVKIVGKYLSEEKVPSGFGDMGLARAEAARISFRYSKNKVVLESDMISSVEDENCFEAVEFSSVIID